MIAAWLHLFFWAMEAESSPNRKEKEAIEKGKSGMESVPSCQSTPATEDYIIDPSNFISNCMYYMRRWVGDGGGASVRKWKRIEGDMGADMDMMWYDTLRLQSRVFLFHSMVSFFIFGNMFSSRRSHANAMACGGLPLAPMSSSPIHSSNLRWGRGRDVGRAAVEAARIASAVEQSDNCYNHGVFFFLGAFRHFEKKSKNLALAVQFGT